MPSSRLSQLLQVSRWRGFPMPEVRARRQAAITHISTHQRRLVNLWMAHRLDMSIVGAWLQRSSHASFLSFAHASRDWVSSSHSCWRRVPHQARMPLARVVASTRSADWTER